MISASLMTGCIGSKAAYAASVDSMKNQQKQNSEKISDLNEEKAALAEEKSKIQNEIEKLSAQILQQSKLVNEKNESVAKYNSEIKKLQDGIKEIEEDMLQTSSEMDSLQENIDEKEKMLGLRLRGMYKQNMFSNIAAILLNSQSFTDLISRIEGISRIIQNDSRMISEVKDDMALLEEKEDKLETQRESMAEEKAKLNDAKDILLSEKKEYESALKELQAIESSKAYKRDSLTAEQKKIYDEIASLEESNDDLQKDIENFLGSVNSGNAGNQSSNSGSGASSASGFIRPVGDGVTSSFGYRIHPVTGVSKLHTGTDFGSSYGTPVKASNSGTVVMASSYGGYGNTVIIDHGNGIQTLYAHNSSLAVKNGQKVSKGQVISYVGSTGMSTGPHLHFEVRVNGTPVNPSEYIK